MDIELFKTFFQLSILMKKTILGFQLYRLKIFFFFFCVVQALTTYSQTASRIRLSMDDGWKFIKDADWRSGEAWQPIHLPHTWNTNDVLDDEPGYYRGAGWYKKVFTIGNQFKSKEVSIYFEGANQETEIYINGKNAGAHVGGYTGFSIPITSFLKFGEENELLVKVDNSYNANIPPLTADFTFYGGIYRDVYLTAENKIHFSTDDFGSNGVYITTPLVSKEKASVGIKCVVTNHLNAGSGIVVVTAITDQNGATVATTKSSIEIDGRCDSEIFQTIRTIRHPKLWSPERPYLYIVKTKITDANGNVLDEVVNPLGFRWFQFDADKGFFLNGKPCKLVGTGRHQDYEGLGNAVPDSLAVQDVVLLKKMGANFLRVSHYPQDPCILHACDSLGLLASVEIPIVNEITESEFFYKNCEQMLKEMIRQNFNHPSVVVWCYMNEVLLKPHFTDDKEKQKQYIVNVTSLARRLENLTRREDHFRYTMMADHGNLSQYKNAGLLEIPMIIGWNLYSGWYGGSMDDFPLFLDKFHKEFPFKPFMVTEYGADADPRIRSDHPVRFDKSIEYATRFHQFYFTEMMKRPYVAGAVVWNLADFNSETRTETMPHMNNKGLLRWNRKPKDPYFFYQAILSKKPFIKILGSCQKEFGIADSGSAICNQPIQVATNLDSIVIFLNGVGQAQLKVTGGLCEWKLPFREGQNIVVAEGRKNQQIFEDSSRIQFHLQAPCLANKQIPFKEINILLGSARYFRDQKGQWWQPDQVYQKGGWGFVGGRNFRIDGNTLLPYGTDKNIKGTDDDPIYQTQQTGIQHYRFEVPPGNYELVFHFAELTGGKVKFRPYNLSDDERTEKIKKRVFNVNVNGRVALDHFNIAEEYGLAKAVVKTTTVTVNNNDGITVDFTPIEDEPVLNALQLKKLN